MRSAPIHDYQLHDSGSRETFATGSHRDTRTGKGRYDLLSAFALDRDAYLLELGAIKYDARNWEKGMPFSRCFDSALRHLLRYIAGHDDEDHLAAARFNIACIMHFEAAIQLGLLPPELNDLPNYSPKETPNA